MSNFKVGDKVRINSPRAKSHGMVGEIKFGEWDNMITVYIPEMDMARDFSVNSLMKIENSKKQESKGEKKLGIFSMNNFDFSIQYAFGGDIILVKAYTVEHCLKIHDELCEAGEIGPYIWLLFDGKVYEVEVEKKIVSRVIKV